MKKPQALIGLLAALGTTIGVLVAVVGLPYGRSDYTAFATLYHGATNTAGSLHVALDCNTATAADDTSCNVLLTGAPQTTTVDVTIGNSTAGAALIAAYNFTVKDPDTTRLDAVTPGSCTAPKLECNPDFLDTTESTEGLGGTNWNCDPVSADLDANNANGDDSLLSCVNIVDPPSLAAGPAHLDLGRVTYNVPILAAVGSVLLTTADVNVFDESISEIMSCNPGLSPCFDTTINFIVPPPTDTPQPATATNTNTPVPPTNTPTNTPVPPTATSTPSDSGLQKVAEGNANNTGPGPSANLWICQTGPCSGPGEGQLRVVERALNVITQDDNADTIADGLGAYEFSVEYDNFVISSVNPCDLVFSTQASIGNGAGFLNRGPVDEVNSSSPANADCTPDAGPVVNNGTCANSIVTENIVHFGCVTAGQAVGPNGNFDVASLELIPHEDLSNDLFPGNNNGVLTVIKDNGCELVNVFGHPIPGSVNGGLTVLCGDLAVTVRILEGDIDLNCSVTAADAQAIASHYGAFFGGLLYSKWLDLEPQFHDLDIDIKDIQKVFGRIGSTCQNPIPAQPPLPPPTPFGP